MGRKAVKSVCPRCSGDYMLRVSANELRRDYRAFLDSIREEFPQVSDGSSAEIENTEAKES